MGLLKKQDLVLSSKRKLDLKTMLMERVDEEITGDSYNYSEWTNRAVSSSEIGVRHESESEDSFVRIVDENDHFLHVQFEFPWEKADTLICKKDPNYTGEHTGEHLLTSETSPLFLAPDSGVRDTAPLNINQVDGSLASLLPGEGGALVVTSCTRQRHRQLVAYVEPVPSLHTVLLCTVPPCR